MAEQINPAAMTPAEAARILTAACGRQVMAETIQQHLELGAPQQQGRLHLVHYAAWLVQRLGEQK